MIINRQEKELATLLNQVQEVALSSLTFQVTIHKSSSKNNKHFKMKANLEKVG